MWSLCALGVAACSSDEPGSDNIGQFEGDTAYMTVNIGDAATLSRSTTTPEENDGFVHGTGNETKVLTAHFYFFDKSGLNTGMQASIWKEGSGSTNNIEHMGQNVVVLKNLDSQNYPEYMLTVINQPAGWQPAGTLELTAKSLEANSTWKNGNEDIFVMSTTSYFNNGDTGANNGNHDDTFYYANKLKRENFMLEPAPATPSENVVNVYVERLAAKVELDIDAPTVTLADGSKAYEVTVSVAGNSNGDVGNNTGATKVYVKVDGWGLNATAKRSTLSKQLTPKAAYLTWSNSPANWRSYWGESFGYGQTVSATAANDVLNYVGWDRLNVALGTAAYCNEYTNTPANITRQVTNTSGTTNKVVSALTTSVLLQATVCDFNGRPLDMVQFNGLMFNRDTFLNYVLNHIDKGTKSQLNFWVKTSDVAGENGSSSQTYKQIDASFMALAAAGTGTGKVVPVAKAKDGVTVYTRTLGSDGKFTYTPVTDFEAALNQAIANESTLAGIEATAFTNGAMFYSIPVEHLQATAATQAANNIVEGYYGVVRNHYYKMTVSKIMKLGYGVFNPGDAENNIPGEPLIPDNPDDYKYYVGAKINILSWKVVEQRPEI